jgi:hypothetical protein
VAAIESIRSRPTSRLGAGRLPDARLGNKNQAMQLYWGRYRRRPRVSVLVVAIYLIVGAFVAASHHYFNHVEDARGIADAVLAMLLWPLVLFGLKITL